MSIDIVSITNNGVKRVYWKSLEYPAPWGGDENDLRFLAVGGADTYFKAVALIPRTAWRRDQLYSSYYVRPRILVWLVLKAFLTLYTVV